MIGCQHVYKPAGKFYNRRERLLGGQVFTVYSCRECTRCNRQERKVVQRKLVDKSPDTFERQLQFSGVKPDHLLN